MIVCILLFSSCNSDVVFEKHVSLGDDLAWASTDSMEIILPVSENSHPYRLEIAFRCASGFAYTSMPLRITEKDPEGSITRYDVEVPVRDAEGNFFGEKGYDIIDITHPLSTQKTFPRHGDYHYTIVPAIPDGSSIDFPMEIGLVLRDPQKR